MANRKFGSRDDLQLSPVITIPGQTPDSLVGTSDTESEEALDHTREVTPMLEKPPPDNTSTNNTPTALADLYAKPKPRPKPKPRKSSNPNLLLEGQEGGEGIKKPAPRPRNQSKPSTSSFKEQTGENIKQGIPPPLYTDIHQPSTSDFSATRQRELYGVDTNNSLNNTGERIDTTSIGEVSQVQQFNFLPAPPTTQMGEVDDQPSPTGMLGWLGFGCSVFALACLCVSFASPYWMQSYPLSFNNFQNMGLWEVCMQDYMHHKDDSMDIYDGCWWVFNREEKYWKLREWLLPPWFITCQVMVTMNLLCQFATIGIVALIFLHCCPTINHEYHQSYAMFAASGLCFFITILTLITGIMYALFCGDRNWMPRPDLNFISWGFGFLIIQGIISTAAGVCYFLEAQKAFNELDRRDQEYTKAVLDMEMSQAYPTNFSAPSYGHQSYDQGSTYSQGGGGGGSSNYGPPLYPGKQSYNTQPGYDNYSTSRSEKGGSLSYEKPPYPPSNT